MSSFPFQLAEKVSGYARLLRKRRLGNVAFWDVRLKGHSLQLLLSESRIADYRDVLKCPLGSSIWLEGIACLSKTGEFSIDCTEVRMVGRCELSLADKRHGMQQGTRYARRLDDLLSNRDVFEFFGRISQTTRIIREFLWSREFQEFSTGVLQESKEVGSAGVFTTRCNANGKTYYLPITSETKLRRLQIAGFDDVFEILQSFRNEGIDTTHSPEFTLLEAYKVGGDWRSMAALLEDLIREVILKVYGSVSLKCESDLIDFATPFRRISFYGACGEYLDLDQSECTLEGLIQHYPALFSQGMGQFTWVFKTINKLLSPRCERPTFITGIPSGISPFVKIDSEDEGVTERAALVVRGIDLADVYSDENDAQKVKAVMERQFADRATQINAEYLHALNYGVPPSGSFGLGLNRLFMLMRGETLPANIRETILHPLQ
jgi:lysyl-tRNA synthetase class 2